MSESGKPAQSCQTTSFPLQSARVDKMSGLPQNLRGGRSTFDQIEKARYWRNLRKKPPKNKIPQNLPKDPKPEKRNQTKNLFSHYCVPHFNRVRRIFNLPRKEISDGQRQTNRNLGSD